MRVSTLWLISPHTIPCYRSNHSIWTRQPCGVKEDRIERTKPCSISATIASRMKFQRLWSFIQSHTHTQVHTHTHTHTHTHKQRESVLTDLLSFPTDSLNLPEQSCGWEDSRGGVLSGALCKAWVSHKVKHTLISVFSQILLALWGAKLTGPDQTKWRRASGWQGPFSSFLCFSCMTSKMCSWYPFKMKRWCLNVLTGDLWSSQPMRSGKHTRARQ